VSVDSDWLYSTPHLLGQTERPVALRSQDGRLPGSESVYVGIPEGLTGFTSYFLYRSGFCSASWI